MYNVSNNVLHVEMTKIDTNIRKTTFKLFIFQHKMNVYNCDVDVNTNTDITIMIHSAKPSYI